MLWLFLARDRYGGAEAEHNSRESNKRERGRRVGGGEALCSGGFGFGGSGEHSAGRKVGSGIWGLSTRALLEKARFGCVTFQLYVT